LVQAQAFGPIQGQKFSMSGNKATNPGKLAAGQGHYGLGMQFSTSDHGGQPVKTRAAWADDNLHSPASSQKTKIIIP
jgi:hypothetical protein